MSTTLSIDDGVTTVVPGTSDTYFIVVSNTGPSPVTGASVSDPLPAGVTAATWANTASSGGGSVSGPTNGSGSLATTVNLPVNASVTFTFTTTINPSVTGSLVNAATVLPPGGTPFVATDTDTLTPVADLSVIITDGRTTVAPSTTYTIVVSNAGPSTAVGGTVIDQFPAAITSASWTAVASAGSSVAQATGNGNILNAVTLLPGGTATFTAVAQVSPSATGLLTNAVTVVPPAGTDPNLANNTATDTDTPSTLTTATSPTVTLSASRVTLSDSATLSGGSNPTGTITFTLTAPGGTTVDTETVTANGNGNYATPVGFTLPTAGTVVGTYSWHATYSGDPNNNAATAPAEPTVVSPASPGLSTTASPGGIAGTTLTDIAQLSGGYFPTGTIIFLLTAPGGTTVDTEVVAVNGDGTYATPTGFTLPKGTVPGTYSWTATYSGGPNNNAAIANSENVTVGVNPPPPPGTTADMILRHSTDGTYEIYDIGNNSILMARPLGQVGTEWTVAGLGGFFGNDTTDMLLRDSNNGAFEVYDIRNNNITNAAFMGAVGMNWQVMGFGDFSSMPGETDMILRNSNTGGVEVYDISNNQITGAAFMGAVGLNWQFSGVGNFSGLGESDMLLRNSNTGGLEVYDINNNQITGAAFIGTIGLDWQFSGVGNFSGVPGETDLVLRNNKTGGLELYDIANNQITGAAFIGTVGLDWQFAGIGPVHGAGESDLVLRNVNTGQFEVYDIANNQITSANSLGSVDLDFQVGGFAADPPTASMGISGSASELVQAMAGFGGGGGGQGLNTVPLSTETSQQPSLTTPQHA
jgi:uncharacterized repeat protein (TIGR01451 family)